MAQYVNTFKKIKNVKHETNVIIAKNILMEPIEWFKVINIFFDDEFKLCLQYLNQENLDIICQSNTINQKQAILSSPPGPSTPNKTTEPLLRQRIGRRLGIPNVGKGGAPKSIHILGRNRKIYKIDRKSYITYKGEKILLSVAKKIKLKSKTKN